MPDMRPARALPRRASLEELGAGAPTDRLVARAHRQLSAKEPGRSDASMRRGHAGFGGFALSWLPAREPDRCAVVAQPAGLLWSAKSDRRPAAKLILDSATHRPNWPRKLGAREPDARAMAANMDEAELRPRAQSRGCAISRPRMFSGTPYSSITFLIAVRSSGASAIPTNRAGVPLI